MRQLDPYPLWIGSAAEVRDTRALHAAGVAAIVDTAADELPVAVPRELAYCRFPMVDGPGNEDWLVQAAIQSTTLFIRSRVPTLVCCSAGMSRSPAIVAAALAAAEGRPLQECLLFITRLGACDVSPGLWEQVCSVSSAVSADRMSPLGWNDAETARAQEAWSQYQRAHDVSDRIGQTAGIDPVSGRVWFGESAADIWRQMNAAGIDVPLYYVRVGLNYYVRK